ncbi:hypothetical protein Syun_016361 [Stephania yunnanensis]|uniref:Uncharacterized protein n=1 Tax=Stephania yunnanensis TaxID=152371 RepID=A0AAP0J515_9MAGN
MLTLSHDSPSLLKPYLPKNPSLSTADITALSRCSLCHQSLSRTVHRSFPLTALSHRNLTHRQLSLSPRSVVAAIEAATRSTVVVVVGSAVVGSPFRVRYASGGGLRSLGVAYQEVPDGTKDGPGGHCEFVGLLPLFDPPRHDSAETIRKALDLGVSVKMITSDQLAIAKETGRRLGMGANMYPSTSLLGEHKDGSISTLPIDELIEKADGFAGVFPGWRYYFILLLEFSDITMPMVRTIFAKVSDGISFFLVCLIGRSLGLIYKGIRQSLGSDAGEIFR